MESLKKNYKYLLGEGIVFILFGILALLFPAVASFGFEFFLGTLFILLGLFIMFQRSKIQEVTGNTVSILSGILLTAVGVGLFIFPTIGLLSLTLLISFLFFVDGCFKLVLAFKFAKVFSKWIWVLLNAIIEFIIAFIVWSQWPISSLWFIGILVGVNLLFIGFTGVMLALEAKNYVTKS